MTRRKTTGRALFYTRDSGGKHEMTPAEYVAWACRRAAELGLSFDGTAARMDAMIQEGRWAAGDLFLDYDVKGNVLSRKGLNGLIQEVGTDAGVTHVFIPRRDRLARPDDPTDGIRLENLLRENGVTLVFLDKVLPPLVRGGKRDLGEMIVALVDYDRSRQDRRELAQKIIFAQLALAKMGFSIGGRPPYGFRRWLVKQDGTPVRRLEDRERVRMPGHHVMWLPGPEDELAVLRRILAMLPTTPACRVAATLTAEGVPPPDCGRLRTDRGLQHPTAGVWRQSVVVGIARHPLVAALVAYGRRSMGDQLRYTPEGPRELQEADWRPDGKAKVVRNPEESLVVAPARFEPLLAAEQRQKLLATLDARGGKQRGKPRAQDPARNPLGCRVFDLNCGWPMYRVPQGESFGYTCGLYQQSHGQRCDHNHLDGLTATRFLLGCIRQRVLAPGLLAKVEKRLTERAERELSSDRHAAALQAKQATLAGVRMKLEAAGRNMALAANEAQFQAMAAAFEELRRQQEALEAEISAGEAVGAPRPDPKAAVAAALALARRLTEFSVKVEDLVAVGELFRQVNVCLFARFRQVQEKKRKLNKLVSGVVTFGSAPPPVTIYEGATSRKKVKGPATPSGAAGPNFPTSPPTSDLVEPGREGESLGNVRRGDWIRTSDLLNPIRSLGPLVRTCKSIRCGNLHRNPGRSRVLRKCRKSLLYGLDWARKGTKRHCPGPRLRRSHQPHLKAAEGYGLLSAAQDPGSPSRPARLLRGGPARSLPPTLTAPTAKPTTAPSP
jgi:DNA invertase Pin-like site-specific DNA recombinase